MIADLTDSGQAFNALTIHRGFEGFEAGRPAAPPDAVVHFAAIPRVLIEPDNVTFTKNVISTYNVIEAAMKLGVRKVIIASSETTYGVCFAEGDKDFRAFPLEEDYDVDPMDSYGLSKVCNEKTARAFAMRYRSRHLRAQNRQRDRAARVRHVQGLPRRPAEPQALRLELHRRARPRRDRAACAWKRTGSAFQVFNATNDTITLNTPTKEAMAKLSPNTPFTRAMGEYEAPLSNRKAREVLGFKERHDARQDEAPGRKPVGRYREAFSGPSRAIRRSARLLRCNSCRRATTRLLQIVLSRRDFANCL